MASIICLGGLVRCSITSCSKCSKPNCSFCRFHRSTFSTRFVSLFYGEIETNGNFIYVNAGHPPPFLVNGKKVRKLEATGTVLGPLPDLTLQRTYAHISPGGVLVLYSDGIFDRWNRQNEQFGFEHFEQLVMEHRTKPPRQMIDAIFKEVDSFGEEKKWEDDATMVVIKRLDA